jgi:glycine C-acetyltransferase
MMSNDALGWIETELAELAAKGLGANIRTIDSPMDGWVTIDGRRVLNFCANNYLGLANHPRITRRRQTGHRPYGVGPGAVRTIAGTMTLHLELERKLAEFKHADACITFQSGFTANSAPCPR